MQEGVTALIQVIGLACILCPPQMIVNPAFRRAKLGAWPLIREHTRSLGRGRTPHVTAPFARGTKPDAELPDSHSSCQGRP